MIKKFINQNFYKYTYKTFSLSKKPTKDIVSSTIEPKYCYINNPLLFNDYGLYLVAEHLFRKPTFFDITNLTVFCYFASLNIYMCLGLLVFLNRDTVSNTFLLTNIFSYVTQVYLTKDMDKVVLKYYFPPVYRMYAIKDIKLLNKEQFEEIYHGQFAIVMINEKKTYIPIDIIIHKKEIFSAIFQGYEIKLFKDDIKANHIKLNSNDRVNYI
jgi:hypothetical protein